MTRRCQACHGTGQDDDNAPCLRCFGSGELEIYTGRVRSSRPTAEHVEQEELF